jgi:hypothetical protein
LENLKGIDDFENLVLMGGYLESTARYGPVGGFCKHSNEKKAGKITCMVLVPPLEILRHQQIFVPYFV